MDTDTAASQPCDANAAAFVSGSLHSPGQQQLWHRALIWSLFGLVSAVAVCPLPIWEV